MPKSLKASSSIAKSPRKQQSGFTLIEVMIAVLILLVGLLGVAGIQLISFHNNQSAYLRSQATFIASDFPDRIRSNPAGQQANAYDSVTVNSGSAVTTPACLASTSGCSGADLADSDIADLAGHFALNPPTLPNGSATVQRDNSSGFDEYIVTVFWSEKDWSGNGTQDARANTTRQVQLRTIIK